MRTPCAVLADADMCPAGFFVDAEVKMGQNWADYNDDPKKGFVNLEGMRGVNG